MNEKTTLIAPSVSLFALVFFALLASSCERAGFFNAMLDHIEAATFARFELESGSFAVLSDDDKIHIPSSGVTVIKTVWKNPRNTHYNVIISGEDADAVVNTDMDADYIVYLYIDGSKLPANSENIDITLNLKPDLREVKKEPEPLKIPIIVADEIVDFGINTAIEKKFKVGNVADWDAAVSTINSSGTDKNYVITLTGSFYIEGIGATTNQFTATNIRVSISGVGQTITLSSTTASNGALLKIRDNQTVILRDVTLHGKDGNTSALVKVENGGTFIMRSGKITENKQSGQGFEGGGVHNAGTFYMYGGSIEKNTIDQTTTGSEIDGGGVYNAGTFNMSGGEISGNTAKNSMLVNSNYNIRGGGVYNAGIFDMSGGSIKGNTVFNLSASGSNKIPMGGGVYNAHDFNMTGGEMKGNKAANGNTGSSYGGGVYTANSSTFDKTGGIIYGSDANDSDKNRTTPSNSVNSLHGSAVYYNDYGKYRDTTLGENNDISTDNYENWDQ